MTINDGGSRSVGDIADEVVSRFKSKRLGKFGMLNEGEFTAESVLEQSMWHFLRKVRGEYESIDGQVQCGRYRVDVVVKASTRRIGIEADGAKYHDANKDAIRDRELITGGHLDEVIRIPYAPMTFYSYATLGVLETWHPSVFTFSHPSSCLSRNELDEEFAKRMNRSDDSRADTEFEFQEWLNAIEIFSVTGNIGFAGSWKQLEQGHKVYRITRRTKQDLL